MDTIQNRLDYACAVVDWLLDLGDEHIRVGAFDDALKYNCVAGSILVLQNRDLVSVRIESNLRLIATRLAEQGLLQRDPPTETRERERCLHVLTEAGLAGGHTAMACRWITNDDNGRIHCVALLSQEAPVPASLQQAVENSGGRIYKTVAAESLVNRAVWLRRLAAEDADYVILHVDPTDVICGVAFGIPGGPPVMLVNHAAHLFWNGTSTTDLIVNCRGSELETFWSATYRGVGFSRCAIVPIPLLDQKSPKIGSTSNTELNRQFLKKLDIASDAIVILTIGSSFKYLPLDGLDFLEIWKDILKAVPEAVLLAVGFDGNRRWKAASAQVGNRIRTFGPMLHTQLLTVQRAADIYVEAFPFGSTTSLLECGLNSIPVCLAPAQSPPPYATDGIALDNTLQRAATVAEYKAKVIQLCRSTAERAAEGISLRDSILRHHGGCGWKKHIETVVSALPREHTVFPEINPMRTPAAIHEYWSLFVSKWTMDNENALETALSRALSLALRPRLTASIKQACRDFRALRSFRTIPVPLLTLLLNVLLPLLPAAWSIRLLRGFIFLCRGSLSFRVWNKIVRSVGLADGPVSPYQEYRRMHDGSESSGRQGQGVDQLSQVLLK